MKLNIRKEYLIAVVVIFAIACLYWGIKFLKGIDMFSKKTVLYAVYPRLDNLLEANPVLVKGYKIGTVNKISLIRRNGQYEVLVKMLITENVNIPKNSVAKVVSTDLLGSKAIEITYGNSTELVVENDTLLSEAEQGLKEAVDKRIAPLQAKIENLIGSIDSVATIVTYVLNKSSRQNIIASLESTRKAILSLEHTAQTFEQEAEKISQIISKLNSILTTLDKNLPAITKNLNQLSDSLANAPLKNTIKDLNKTLAETKVLLANINEGKGTLGKLAKNDSVYNNLNKSLANLEQLLGDLKAHPKRYVHFSLFGKKDKVKN
ncbi:MAG: organic solvent ABC transporter substrate-binding protein [Bacteroidia bacterium]|nr:MAG: organic solvent ABC transporter substrate-binding protein [Bacteroidia bacterium]